MCLKVLFHSIVNRSLVQKQDYFLKIITLCKTKSFSDQKDWLSVSRFC